MKTGYFQEDLVFKDKDKFNCYYYFVQFGAVF